MSSYITLPAAQVITLCEDWIAKRKAYIISLQEPLVQKAMKPRLFGLIKAKTREEALAHLQGDIWNDFNLAKLCDGYRASLVSDLYKAAKLAGEGNVRVSSEQAGIIY
jgi:hypothetical protein